MERMLLIGFRAKPEEVARLDALAKASRRTRSDVMRVLLDQAVLRPDPDIALRDPGNGKQDRVEVRQ